MSELPPALQASLDQAKAAVRNSRADAPEARREQRCAASPVGCGRPIASLATEFRDQASRDEYEITRLCQSCQDALFAPSADEVAAMAADSHNYGRCCVCGEYRAYEFVDVGVGVIKGFNCCTERLETEDLMALPRCSATDDTGQCFLRQDHAHGHDFPEERT